MQEFKLVFDPPDFQMRPPVVGCFVILLLSRLMEITRDLLCTAIDAFPPETPYPDTQRECLQEVRYVILRHVSSSMLLNLLVVLALFFCQTLKILPFWEFFSICKCMRGYRCMRSGRG